jgi:DNA-directed RNA polymerase subunit RPC12/RpoP
MAYETQFTPEEEEFLAATKALIRSDSKSKLFVQALIGQADDLMESGGLIFNNHNLQFLSQISQSPDVKTMAEMRRNAPRCPECSKKLVGLCGRLECTVCNLTFFVETPNTRAQCPKCSSYRDRNDPAYQSSVYHGFGTGCPSVHGKGNEIELYKKLKLREKITPQEWRARNNDDTEEDIRASIRSSRKPT